MHAPRSGRTSGTIAELTELRDVLARHARKAPYPVGKAMNDAAADRCRRYLHKLRMPAHAALAVFVRAPQSRSERGGRQLSGNSDPALGPILPRAVMIRSWLNLFARRRPPATLP